MSDRNPSGLPASFTDRAYLDGYEAGFARAKGEAQDEIDMLHKALKGANAGNSELRTEMDTEVQRVYAMTEMLQADLKVTEAEINRLRELFKKYMNHVASEEGSTFIPYKLDGFSIEEIKALETIDAEATATLVKEVGK